MVFLFSLSLALKKIKWYREKIRVMKFIWIEKQKVVWFPKFIVNVSIKLPIVSMFP
jgi:hypothetical protein